MLFEIVHALPFPFFFFSSLKYEQRIDALGPLTDSIFV